MSLHKNTYQGRSPLHLAVIAGKINMTDLLLDAGGKEIAHDQNRDKPLHPRGKVGAADLWLHQAEAEAAKRSLSSDFQVRFDL